MADTKRQQIVNNIKAALVTIKIVNGYATNLGNNISRWRLSDYAAAEGLGASIYDYDEKSLTGENLSGPHKRAVKIEIEVKAPQVLDAPAEMLQAFADIEAVIGANQNWGGLAIKTVPAGNKLTVEQGTKKIAGGILSIEVHYFTQPFNAYE